jgi:hypothetical protein
LNIIVVAVRFRTEPDEIAAAPHVDGDASESYLDWRVGISKEVFGFGLDVSDWDAENEVGLLRTPVADLPGTVVGTIPRRF